MLTQPDLHHWAMQQYDQLEHQFGLFAVGAREHLSLRPVFFRGRRSDLEHLTPPENRFSYPPPSIGTEFGRANIPYHPVFYAGGSVAAIATELNLRCDDWFHLAVFFAPQPVQFRYLLLIHDEFGSQGWGRMRDELFEHLVGRHDLPESPESVWGRLQRTVEVFRTSQHETSAAIAHRWLYGNRVDAILYPSVRNDAWVNFAIHPDFVDRNLALYCVLACRLRSSEMELHMTGVPSESGELSWHTTTREDWQEYNSGYQHLSVVA